MRLEATFVFPCDAALMLQVGFMLPYIIAGKKWSRFFFFQYKEGPNRGLVNPGPDRGILDAKSLSAECCSNIVPSAVFLIFAPEGFAHFTY